MSSITVRAAQPDDCDVIVEFNRRLAAESENHRLDAAVVTAGVRAVLCDPQKGRYYVACADGQVVGQIMLTREWSDWRNGDIWWLQSVYVAPDFRRQGVFRQLYDHVRQEAAAATDVVGLRLYVERENHRAQETYQRLGMQPTGYFVMQHLF